MMFGVGPEPPSGVVESDAVADRGEHVLEIAPGRVVVEDLGSGGQRNPVLPGQTPEADVARTIAVEAMSGQQEVEAGTERLPKPVRESVGGRIPEEDRISTAPQRVESRCVLGDLFGKYPEDALAEAARAGASPGAAAGSRKSPRVRSVERLR